jgi:regulator of replication initiation timing
MEPVARNKRQLHEDGECECAEQEKKLKAFKKPKLGFLHHTQSGVTSDGSEVEDLRKHNQKLLEELEKTKVEMCILRQRIGEDHHQEEHAHTEDAESFSAQESRIKIKAMVKQFMLNNPQSRTGFMPACVEEAIYSNALCILVRVMEDVLSTASVDFLGHRLQFSLSSHPQ